jgi:hypothetical protein
MDAAGFRSAVQSMAISQVLQVRRIEIKPSRSASTAVEATSKQMSNEQKTKGRGSPIHNWLRTRWSLVLYKVHALDAEGPGVKLGFKDYVGELMRFGITAMATSGELANPDVTAAKEEEEEAIEMDSASVVS